MRLLQSDLDGNILETLSREGIRRDIRSLQTPRRGTETQKNILSETESPLKYNISISKQFGYQDVHGFQLVITLLVIIKGNTSQLRPGEGKPLLMIIKPGVNGVSVCHCDILLSSSMLYGLTMVSPLGWTVSSWSLSLSLAANMVDTRAHWFFTMVR